MQVESPIDVAALKPKGLGGWLLLPIFGLAATPVLVILTLFNDILPSFEPEVWDFLTSPASEAYSPFWAPLFFFEAAGSIALMLGALALLFILFSKKKILPVLMIVFYLCNFLFSLADSVVSNVLIATVFPDVANELSPEATKNLIRSVVVCAVWIPYFSMSTRVSNTFVK